MLADPAEDVGVDYRRGKGFSVGPEVIAVGDAAGGAGEFASAAQGVEQIIARRGAAPL
jgi:hypothetical protein